MLSFVLFGYQLTHVYCEPKRTNLLIRREGKGRGKKNLRRSRVRCSYILVYKILWRHIFKMKRNSPKYYYMKTSPKTHYTIRYGRLLQSYGECVDRTHTHTHTHSHTLNFLKRLTGEHKFNLHLSLFRYDEKIPWQWKVFAAYFFHTEELVWAIHFPRFKSFAILTIYVGTKIL